MIVSDKKDKNLYNIIFTTNKVGIKLCCRAEKKAGVKIAGVKIAGVKIAGVKIAAYIRTL